MRRIAALVLLVLLGALLWLVLAQDDDAEPAREETPVADATEVPTQDEERKRVRTVSGAHPTPVEVDELPLSTPAASVVMLTICVRSETGDRLTDAVVTVRRTKSAVDAEFTAMTDAGFCEFSLPPGAYEVSARHGKRFSLPKSLAMHSAGDEQATLWVRAPLGVEVHVVDATDVAISDAEVQLHFDFGDHDYVNLNGTTDAQGRFSGEFPAAGAHELIVVARHDWWSRATRELSADELADGAPIRIVMRRLELRGRVVDDAGRVLPEGEVWVYLRGDQWFGGFESIWKEDGTFSEAGEPSMPPTHVLVKARDHAPRFLELPPVESEVIDCGDIVLERGRRVTGRVIDSDGAPVNGAEVLLCSGDRSMVVAGAVTEPDGTYVFPAVGLDSDLLAVRRWLCDTRCEDAHYYTEQALTDDREQPAVQLVDTATFDLRVRTGDDDVSRLPGTIQLWIRHIDDDSLVPVGMMPPIVHQLSKGRIELPVGASIRMELDDIVKGTATWTNLRAGTELIIDVR